VEFFESSVFSQRLGDYLDDDAYRFLQLHLGRQPESGDLVPGTGGFRKLRWRDPTRGKGTRGGLRVIYYFYSSHHQIWLATIYGKDEVADLSPKEKKALRAMVDEESRKRQARRKEGSGSV
jgi:hypothetical protein